MKTSLISSPLHSSMNGSKRTPTTGGYGTDGFRSFLGAEGREARRTCGKLTKIAHVRVDTELRIGREGKRHGGGEITCCLLAEPVA
jgi:hypothetical protein